MCCPSCNNPIQATDIKCINCGKVLIESATILKDKTASDNNGEMTAKEHDQLTGQFLLVLGFGYPCLMFNTWVNLEPIPISKFGYVVITWEDNPKIYFSIVGLTIAACTYALIKGFILILRKK